MKERITLEDTPKTAIIKLAEGNPGALTVMLSILEKSEAIDPDAFLPMAHIFGLDTSGMAPGFGCSIRMPVNRI